MLNQAKFYNLREVILLMDGLRIEGATDDAFLELAPASDLHARRRSADGQSVFSRLNDSDIMMTVSVHETSSGYRIMTDLIRAQMLVTDQILPLPVSITDPVTGDGIVASQVVCMEFPTVTKSREASDREFVFCLVNARDTALLGRNG